jgi:hypothetical protein
LPAVLGRQEGEALLAVLDGVAWIMACSSTVWVSVSPNWEATEVPLAWVGGLFRRGRRWDFIICLNSCAAMGSTAGVVIRRNAVDLIRAPKCGLNSWRSLARF